MSEGYGKKFQCDYCASKFDFKRNLLAHERNKHGVGFVKIERTYKCKECGSSFESCKSLNRHRSEVHGGIPNEKTFLCKYCDVAFCHLKNMKVHEREKHGVRKPTKPYQCPKCEAQYSKKYTLVVHDRKKHNEETEKLSNYSCPFCGFGADKLELCQHYEDVHNIRIVTRRQSFNNFEDFKRWKETVERETGSKFVQARVCQGNLHGSKNYHFACQNTNCNDNSPDNGQSRSLEAKKKINLVYCPAKLMVTETTDGICSMVFTETHVGHDSSGLEHLLLTDKNKRSAAAKLSPNMSFDDILDEIRNSASEPSLSRSHSVSKKEPNGIKAAFNLSETTAMHHWSETNGFDGNHSSSCTCTHDDGIAMEHSGVTLAHPNSSFTVEQFADLNKIKKALKNDVSALIDSLSSIEEVRMLKRSISSAKSRLGAALTSNRRKFTLASETE